MQKNENTKETAEVSVEKGKSFVIRFKSKQLA